MYVAAPPLPPPEETRKPPSPEVEDHVDIMSVGDEGAIQTTTAPEPMVEEEVRGLSPAVSEEGEIERDQAPVAEEEPLEQTLTVPELLGEEEALTEEA